MYNSRGNLIMAFHHVFSPIQIRGLELRNKVVFPAMGTKMASEDKFVTRQIIDYQVARAKGGNGLNFTEVCSVYAPASPRKFLSVAEDKFIPGLRELTDEVHEAGGKIGIQLWMGGMAAAHGDPAQQIVIPSPVAVPSTEYNIPGASIDTIKATVKAFGEAAKRSVEAGFDTIEFHAGHNYTPHAFLSPAFNKREDEYGGTLENRARYLIECIEAIRENIPEDMPLFMRIDAHDDYLESGLTIEDVIEFCKMAKVAGVDVLDVSRGNFSTAAIKYEVPPIDIPRNFNIENAARIRKETGMLTVGVGRINDPAQAEQLIADDLVDMVVIGRGQLADPEFCNKAIAGKVEDIVRCIGCNQGCYDSFVDENAPFITCLRNPALGREREYEIEKTSCPKKVLVAGGGIAGLEVAMTLKKRGHNPIIIEAGEKLGGQFALAGMAPRKEEMYVAAMDMARQAQAMGIKVLLNTPLTVELLKEIQPEELVMAIGSSPIKMNIKGADLPHVSNSHEVLAGLKKPMGNVVVIGGGLVGLEVAEHVSLKDNNVTVVEMQDEVAKDLGPLRKICVMESMYQEGIKSLTSAKCMEIKEKSILIDVQGEVQEIPADAVVVAVGSKSRPMDEIIVYCEENDLPIHIIGDALKARRALNAVAEANEVARLI